MTKILKSLPGETIHTVEISESERIVIRRALRNVAALSIGIPQEELKAITDGISMPGDTDYYGKRA